MGFVVQYSPDPRTLGSYAFESGAAPARRQNLQRSLDNAQQAAQFNAQLRQHATDRAVNQYDRQQGRAADLQQVAMQQAGYERKNQYELQQAQEKSTALIQQEQMQQQGQRAQKYDEMVQAGLKDGTLFHTPQQKQQMAELQRSIGEIYADTSIAPEQQDAMADRQYKRMRGIVPAVRSQEDVPVPLTGRLAESTAIWTADGRMIPGSERSPQPGEWIGTQVTRNGSQQTKWEQVPQAKPPTDDWNAPKFIAQQREIIRNGLVNQRNSEYDRELRTWQAKQDHYSDGLDRDGPSTSAPPPGPMPSQQKVEDWEVDAKLHAISGGVVMPTIQPPPPPQQVPVAPQPGRVMWPGERQAIEGSSPPTIIDGAATPQQGRGVGGLYRREMNRDVKLAESPAIGEMILNDPEFRQHISKNGNGDMYVGGIIWNRAVVKHSQDRPITVSSQEEAKTLPYGSKFSLNGRTGTVQ